MTATLTEYTGSHLFTEVKAMLSLVSTWMGNRQETLGAVGFHPQQCS